jgi:hypothetical protein
VSRQGCLSEAEFLYSHFAGEVYNSFSPGFW